MSTFVGSIYSSNTKCDCGGRYYRTEMRMGTLIPACDECGDLPGKFIITRKFAGKSYTIATTRQGKELRSLEDVFLASEQATADAKVGYFDAEKYKVRHGRAGSIGETLGSFIERVALKKLAPDTDSWEHRVLLDFMSAHFADTGIFAISEIHYSLFYRTFEYAFRDRKSEVRALWDSLMELVRPQFNRVA